MPIAKETKPAAPTYCGANAAAAAANAIDNVPTAMNPTLR